MKILDRSFGDPPRDLALDEALLERCEAEDSGEVLRFWSSSSPFIVLGFSNAWKEEVKLLNGKPSVPVLRRISGGGAVVQGPGCLNYSLILKIKSGGPLEGILSANRHIMERSRAALEKILGREVRVQGSTDLTVGDLKFSGNSQRRKRRYLLFHGTFLLDLDLSLLDNLKLPPKRPAYRNDRPHGAFVTNIGASPEAVKKAMGDAWLASGQAADVAPSAISRLVEEKYSVPEWNFRL